MTNAFSTDRWKSEQHTKACRRDTIIEVFARRRHASWLRGMLQDMGIRYRDYTIGQKVRVITTDMTTCPCCKRPMEVK